MSAKVILKSFLIAFIVVSLGFLAIKEGREAADHDASAPSHEPPAPPAGSTTRNAANSKEISHKVVAYYFHTNYRCVTCRKIEALSRDAIKSGFSRELDDRRLQWELVNYEQPQNQHYIQAYRLFSNSLVVVNIKDGRQTEWKNLGRVWELLGSRDAFTKYVQDEVRAYLER